MKNKKTLLNLEHARLPAQKEKMAQIIKDGVCPFCPQYFKKYHDSVILRKGKHWLVTWNDYPYPETKYHFLIISKKHLIKINEISQPAGAELADHFKWLKKQYKINDGILLTRFGNTKKTGATIEHLHSHLIVGKKKNQTLHFSLNYKK